MKPEFSLKVTSIIICIIYLLSICATLPFAFMLKVKVGKYGRRTNHYVDYDTYIKSCWSRVVFWTAIFFATTLTPTAIMTAVYCSASVALTKGSAAMQSSMQWKKRIVRNRKVNRMFIVAVVCFVITVAPYTTYTVVFSFIYKYNILFFEANLDVVIWTGSVIEAIMISNCFINPFVYCKMHKDVLEFIKKMLLAVKTNHTR